MRSISRFSRGRNSFIAFFLTGLLAGAICLGLWNMLGEQTYTLSLLSPHGPEVYILGLRIKHWLIGLVFIGIGSSLYLLGFSSLSGFLIGMGTILFLDELLTGDLYYWRLGG